MNDLMLIKNEDGSVNAYIFKELNYKEDSNTMDVELYLNQESQHPLKTLSITGWY
ncbi:hypothetical protein V9R55_003436 [Vibrio cholerae]|uniref:hypothetical protein n=1 Tax=Vibrio cholerae TaxID=666 RepID=UPI00247AD909|nr:hypothetical protein [Vibrio cholerae]MDH7616837.1 hypothetical protein [Vibrio cholerae]